MAKEREATFRCIEGGLKVMQKIGTDMPQAQNITAVYLLFTKKLDVLRFEEQARNVFFCRTLVLQSSRQSRDNIKKID